jgi:hypothetical protein
MQCQYLATSSDKRLGQPRTLFGSAPAPDVASSSFGFVDTATPQTFLSHLTDRKGDLVRSRFHDVSVERADTLSKAPLPLDRIMVRNMQLQVGHYRLVSKLVGVCRQQSIDLHARRLNNC